MQMNAVVIMTLVLIIALIIIFVGQKIYEKNVTESVIEICRTSVLSQSGITIADISPFSLNCQRRFVDISDDHVAIGNEPDKTKTVPVMVNGIEKKNFAKLDNDIVNYVFAEEMKTCWYEFGEGQIDAFPNDMPFSQIWTSNVCFICSQIDFDKSVGNKKFSGLIKYLSANFIKDKRYTYKEYFNAPSLSGMNWNNVTTTKTLENNYFDKTSDNDVIIDSSKQWSVFYLKYFGTSRLNEAGKTVLRLFGADFDNKENIYYVFAVPTDKLDEICDVQAS